MKRFSLILILVFWLPPTAFAQTETGAICVTTFADVNGNGIRDQDEGLLPGVNIDLSTGGVIIATHIIAPGETQYCFENLLPGIYTVTFTGSPMYRITTADEGTFPLESGQHLIIKDFGAFPIAVSNLRAEVAAQIAAAEETNTPLETSTRLMLATVGSMVVMLFMVGIGAVILGITSGRPSKNAPARSIPPPHVIEPPGS